MGAFGIGPGAASMALGRGLPAAAGAPTRTFTPGGYGGMVARNTGPGSDVAAGRSAGAGTGTFTPSEQSLYPTLTPQQKAMQMIQGQPGYVAAENDANLAQQQGGAARRAAIQQAVLQSGLGIDQMGGFKDVYGDLDPNVMAAAQANPYSDAAQGRHAAQVMHDQDVGNLGATGGWASGDAQAVLGNENYERGLGLHNLATQFSNTANQAIGDYAGVLGTNRTNLANALSSAESSAATNPAFTSVLAPQPRVQGRPVPHNGVMQNGVPQRPTGGQSQFTSHLRTVNF